MCYSDAKKIELLTEQTQNTIRTLKFIRCNFNVRAEVAELLDLKIIAAEQTLDNIKEADKLAVRMEVLDHAS